MTELFDAAMNSKAWPFQEAKKLVKKYAKKDPEKGYVLFETGYGPSGLPHIGTFGEVARTTMVRRAFEAISDIPTKLISFSDDMDGLRKVPDNVPNRDEMAEHLQKPLSDVPDPFGTDPSFGAHNNRMLCEFLDGFGFEYEFASATEYYKSGKFDDILIRACEKYDDIMKVMLASLREERQQTYSPFLPISPTTGRVLYVPMKAVNAKDGTVTFEEDGQDVTLPVTGGNVKLQWKPDFGMRWAALFLDEKGQKISKSSGNGISMDEWLAYAPPESLSYYMYQKPQTAKRLFFDVIPKAVDEYNQQLNGFPGQELAAKLNNPVYHIHRGQVPNSDMAISFSMLLNLASAASAEDKEVLWGFIRKYAPDATAETHPGLDNAAGYAVRYFNDIVKPSKTYRAPEDKERAALQDLRDQLAAYDGEKDAESLQSLVFSVGKAHEFEPLRAWFTAIYEVLLGASQGPRFGGFVALYGVNETVTLIDEALSGAFSA